jgi:glycine cleavage system H protein
MTIKFTKQHEWAKIEGDTATIGITDYAQHQLGDVVFVDLPKMGAVVKQFGAAAVVESVKAASDVYTPLSGAVVAINDNLPANPGQINQSPMGTAWFFKVKLSNPAEADALLSEADYQAYIKGL